VLLEDWHWRNMSIINNSNTRLKLYPHLPRNIIIISLLSLLLPR